MSTLNELLTFERVQSELAGEVPLTDRELPPKALPVRTIDVTDVPTPIAPRCRLTVVENVYHQPPGSDAMAVTSTYARWLDSDEQPHQRKTRIGESWQPIETGWVPEPGLILIENKGHHFQVNPTDRQRKEADAKILLIGVHSAPGDAASFVIPFVEIAPGESLRISPREIQRWAIRCASGFVQTTITAFPK
jgi:hypothetical protein